MAPDVETALVAVEDSKDAARQLQERQAREWRARYWNHRFR